MLLAVALTLVAGSAAVATPGIGAPFHGSQESTRFTASSTYRIGSAVGPGLDLQRYAMVLDLGLIGCLVQYRGCCGSLLILTEPR